MRAELRDVECHQLTDLHRELHQRSRVAAEVDQIETVKRDHADRIAIVPWQIDEPMGIERLRSLARPSGTATASGTV